MTYYVKMTGLHTPLSISYVNQGKRAYVTIPNDGAFHAIPDAAMTNLQDEWAANEVAISANSSGTPLISAFPSLVGGSSGVAGLNTVGVAQAVFIPNGGTVPVGTPTYTIVIEMP